MMRPRRLLVVDSNSDAVPPGLQGANTLVLRLSPGLGGIWSEFPDDREIIRLGYPEHSAHAFFQPLCPRTGTETCASVALGRILFGRRITDIVVRDAALLPLCRHAAMGHDVCLWLGRTEAAAGTPAGCKEQWATILALHAEGKVTA